MSFNNCKYAATGSGADVSCCSFSHCDSLDTGSSPLSSTLVFGIVSHNGATAFTPNASRLWKVPSTSHVLMNGTSPGAQFSAVGAAKNVNSRVGARSFAFIAFCGKDVTSFPLSGKQKSSPLPVHSTRVNPSFQGCLCSKTLQLSLSTRETFLPTGLMLSVEMVQELERSVLPLLGCRRFGKISKGRILDNYNIC